MNKERLHRLELALNTLQSVHKDLIVISEEEDHYFNNIPDNKSGSELAELTVRNAEDIGAAVYDLSIVIDIIRNVVNSNKCFSPADS